VTLGALMNVLDAYSQLRKLAWQLQSTAALCARNRRHLNLDVMTQEERQLMEALDQVFRRVNVPV